MNVTLQDHMIVSEDGSVELMMTDYGRSLRVTLSGETRMFLLPRSVQDTITLLTWLRENGSHQTPALGRVAHGISVIDRSFIDYARGVILTDTLTAALRDLDVASKVLGEMEYRMATTQAHGRLRAFDTAFNRANERHAEAWENVLALTAEAMQ